MMTTSRVAGLEVLTQSRSVEGYLSISRQKYAAALETQSR
jgi:hypothetical protein